MSHSAGIRSHWLAKQPPSSQSPLDPQMTSPVFFNHQVNEWGNGVSSLLISMDGNPNQKDELFAAVPFPFPDAVRNQFLVGKRFPFFEGTRVVTGCLVTNIESKGIASGIGREPFR